ncbi:MAG: type II toxin-antitoxin system prevent-host-death family antitoxin [Acidobacteriota bacterium]|nr:type II toxin-antitoxin system prevent-host-death family antitoxin [Acidobacteriota bacterium]
MVVNTVSEAKASLSELIDKASRGEEIVICRAGRPVAVLRAYRKPERPREPGVLRGKIRIASDFDELPPDLAEALGSTRRR